MTTTIIATVASITSVLLLISIIWDYKNNKNIFKFTIKKLMIMSVMLAVYVVIESIGIGTIPITPTHGIRYTSVFVVIIGFYYGPSMGIVFGMLADLLSILANGWMFSPIMFLQKPILGAIAGVFGVYKLNSTKGLYINYMFAQVALSAVLMTSMIFAFSDSNLLKEALRSSDEFVLSMQIMTASFSVIMFLIVQVLMYLSVFKRDKYKFFKDGNIFIKLVIIYVISTIINSWILTPLHLLTLYGGARPYEYYLITRLITASFSIPFNTILAYLLISGLKPVLKKI